MAFKAQQKSTKSYRIRSSFFFWMYVCMYVCMHVCMYVCIYVSMYVSIYLSIYLSIYVWKKNNLLPTYLKDYMEDARYGPPEDSCRHNREDRINAMNAAITYLGALVSPVLCDKGRNRDQGEHHL